MKMKAMNLDSGNAHIRGGSLHVDGASNDSAVIDTHNRKHVFSGLSDATFSAP